MSHRFWLLLIASMTACATTPARTNQVRPTSPADLCDDATLAPTAFCLPAERIEQLLREGTMSILEVRATTHGITGAQVLLIQFPNESLVIRSKWKAAKHGGTSVNNDPRKELAAYELQKLLLEPSEYVVPPTVARCLPFDLYRTKLGRAKPTFPDTECVFGVFSYWLENVTEMPPIDKQLLEENPAYRATVANMNLVTYLINHRDTRPSNFVLSQGREAPRAFAVDNGMAFSGVQSPRTVFLKDWRTIVVPQLPRDKIERLRLLTREELDRLAVVAQFTVRDHQLEPTAITAPLPGGAGVRRAGDVIQLGLTKSELDALERRIKDVVRDTDSGKIGVY